MVDSRKRIAGAFLIGGALVVGAFVMGTLKNAEAQAGSVIVATIDRNHIAIEDANGDGIPDWREGLVKTEPIMLNEATSTYERPITVTGRFALSFFQDMLRSKMYGAFGDSSEELIEASIADLEKATIDVLFTEEDIETTTASSPEVLRAYGNHVANIALRAQGGRDNEVIILQDTLRYNTPERLQDIDPIAASYVDIVRQMLEVPVPEKYVHEHLDLLNAYNAVREDVSAMQKVYDDPMYTFVRLKRYEDDVWGMANALTQLFDALYLKDNIKWAEGESASVVKNMIDNI